MHWVWAGYQSTTLRREPWSSGLRGLKYAFNEVRLITASAIEQRRFVFGIMNGDRERSSGRC